MQIPPFGQEFAQFLSAVLSDRFCGFEDQTFWTCVSLLCEFVFRIVELVTNFISAYSDEEGFLAQLFEIRDCISNGPWFRDTTATWVDGILVLLSESVVPILNAKNPLEGEMPEGLWVRRNAENLLIACQLPRKASAKEIHLRMLINL